MSIRDYLSNLFNDEEIVTQGEFIQKVKGLSPLYAAQDDEVIANALLKKDVKQYGFLTGYAPSRPVPAKLVPKALRSDKFYTANPDLGVTDAQETLAGFREKYPGAYDDVPDAELAKAIEFKWPTDYKGLGKRILPPKREKGAPEVPGIPAFGEAVDFFEGVAKKTFTPQPPKDPAKKEIGRQVAAAAGLTNPFVSPFLKTERGKRVGASLVSGLASTYSGAFSAVPAAEAFFDLDTPIGKAATKAATSLSNLAAIAEPEDPDFADKFVQGVASMTAFMGAGATAQSVVSQMPRLGAWAARLAPAIGVAVPVVMEAGTEGGSLYKALVDQGMDREIAARKAKNSFLENIVLIGITNKLGIYGEKLKGAAKHVASAFMEGGQELGQSIIEDVESGKPIDKWKAIESGLIGGLIGGPASLVQSDALMGIAPESRGPGGAGVIPGPSTPEGPVPPAEPAVTKVTPETMGPANTEILKTIPGLAEQVVGREIPATPEKINVGIREAGRVKAEALKAGQEEADADIAAAQAFADTVATKASPASPTGPFTLRPDIVEALPQGKRVEAKPGAQGPSLDEVANSLDINPAEMPLDLYIDVFGQGRAVEEVAKEHKFLVEQAAEAKDADTKPGQPPAKAKEEASTPYSAIESIRKFFGKSSTRTAQPPFKAWFGESKVVDQAGQPKVVYHGTTSTRIKSFDLSVSANQFSDTGIGHFFAAAPKEADFFTRGEATETGEYARGANIIPVYLSIKNPKVYDTQADYMADVNALPYEREGSGVELRNKLIAEGHDGIIVKNSQMEKGQGGEWYVAFEPGQIKSAFNQRPDPKNTDILSEVKGGEGFRIIQPPADYKATKSEFEIAAPKKPAPEIHVYEEDPLKGALFIKPTAFEVKFREDGHLFLPNRKVRSPADLAYAFRQLKNELQENLFLGAIKNGRIVGVEHLGFGTIDQVAAYPFETMSLLDTTQADGYFLVHNHPSGEVDPSTNDMNLTESLKAVLAEQKLKFYGHVVIDDATFGFIDPHGLVSKVEHQEYKRVKKLPVLRKYTEWLVKKGDALNGPNVSSPGSMYEVVKGIHLGKEEALVALLNVQNTLINAAVLPQKAITAANLQRLAARYRTQGLVVVQAELDRKAMAALRQKLRVANITLLDAIEVRPNGTYESGADRGWLGEKRAEYGSGIKMSEEPAIYGGSDAMANFKEWFGESKMVDAKGEPLVLYRVKTLATNVKGKRVPQWEHLKFSNKDLGVQEPVYVRMETPVSWEKARAFWKKDMSAREFENTLRDHFDADGVINEKTGDAWVFTRQQLKSAIGNMGEYRQGTANTFLEPKAPYGPDEDAELDWDPTRLEAELTGRTPMSAGMEGLTIEEAAFNVVRKHARAMRDAAVASLDPLVEFIATNSKLRPFAEGEGKPAAEAEEFDAAVPIYLRNLKGAGRPLDAMAENAYDAGLLAEPTTRALLDRLSELPKTLPRAADYYQEAYRKAEDDLKDVIRVQPGIQKSIDERLVARRETLPPVYTERAALRRSLQVQALSAANARRQTILDLTELKLDVAKELERILPAETAKGFLSQIARVQTPQEALAVIERAERVADAHLKSQEIAGRVDQQKAIREERIKLHRLFRRQAAAARLAARSESARIMEVQRQIVDMIQEALPVEVRGKFVKVIQNARTAKHVLSATGRIDDALNDWQKKRLIHAIKRTLQKIQVSKSIAIDYRDKINSLVTTIVSQKSAATVRGQFNDLRRYIVDQQAEGKDVTVPSYIMERLRTLTAGPLAELSVADLENLYNEMLLLSELGRMNFRKKVEMERQLVESDLDRIAASAVPLKTKTLERRPVGGNLPALTVVRNAVNSALNRFALMRHALSPMDVLFDLMDGVQNFTGPVYRAFKTRVDRAYADYSRLKFQLHDELVTKAEGLKRDSFERIGVYAIAQQEGGVEKLGNVGIPPEEIFAIKLSPREMEFYRFMRARLDSLRPYIAQTMKEIYNQDLGQVKNYFPFLTDWTQQDLKDVHERMVIDMPGKSTNVKRGFTETRKGAGRQKVLINAFEIYARHVDDVAYLLKMGATVRHLGRVANNPRFEAAVGDVGQHLVKEWIDTLAKKGGSVGGMQIRALDILRNNIGTAQLALKLSTTLLQPLAVNQGAALIGPWAYKGIANLADPDWRRFLKNNFTEVRDRVGDAPEFLEFTSNSTMNKLKAAGFWAIQKGDLFAASAIASGAYEKFMHEKGLPVDLENPNQEGIEEAQRVVRRTQSSGSFKDLPQALTRDGFTGNRSLNRLLFQFQNFALNEWSLIRHEGIRNLAKGNVGAAGQVFFFLAIAAMMEGGMRMGLDKLLNLLFGYDEEERPPFGERLSTHPSAKYWEPVAKEILTKIPLVGQAMSYYTYGSIPAPALEAVARTGAGLKNWIGADDPMAKRRNMIKAVGGLASVAGVPGTAQLAQVARKAFTEPFRKKLSDFQRARRDRKAEKRRRRLERKRRIQAAHR